MASDNQQRLRTGLFVNCWRYGDDESEAMWRLYCGTNEGVAITLPYAALAASAVASDSTYIGAVTYRDYEKDFIPHGNVLFPCMSKRLSFKHEDEVRIVDIRGIPSAMGLEGPTKGEAGIEIPWDPEASVHGVYVSPYARRWYHEAVRVVTRALAPKLADKVRESGMAAEPVF